MRLGSLAFSPSSSFGVLWDWLRLLRSHQELTHHVAGYGGRDRARHPALALREGTVRRDVAPSHTGTRWVLRSAASSWNHHHVPLRAASMTTGDPIEAAVCVTPSAERAEECTVVLASNGIAHRLETTGAGWMVMVAASDAEIASRVLVEYDRENRDEARSEPCPPPYGPT